MPPHATPSVWCGAAAIRFVRVCVAEKDDFYNRYLVKNNLIAPIIQLYIKNGVKHTNLIHSSIMGLFDFIRLVSRQSALLGFVHPSIKASPHRLT